MPHIEDSVAVGRTRHGDAVLKVIHDLCCIFGALTVCVFERSKLVDADGAERLKIAGVLCKPFDCVVVGDNDVCFFIKRFHTVFGVRN